MKPRWRTLSRDTREFTSAAIIGGYFKQSREQKVTRRCGDFYFRRCCDGRPFESKRNVDISIGREAVFVFLFFFFFSCRNKMVIDGLLNETESNRDGAEYIWIIKLLLPIVAIVSNSLRECSSVVELDIV